MAGLVSSIFGKTVAELTAERQEDTADIINSIMAGAGNTTYDKQVAQLGGNIGIWGGKKLANWFSGGDKQLEAAQQVEEDEMNLRKMLSEGDFTDAAFLRDLANVQFLAGDQAGGSASESRANKRDAVNKTFNDLSKLSEDELNLVSATNFGNESIMAGINKVRIQRALTKPQEQGNTALNIDPSLVFEAKTSDEFANIPQDKGYQFVKTPVGIKEIKTNEYVYKNPPVVATQE
jgi:hypothetical protein